MVTAEAAMVLPVLVCLTVALAWVVLLAVAQVRCIDAVRKAARLVARGEPEPTVAGVVDRLPPGAASWAAVQRDGLVVVQVTAEVRPQLPLIGGLPAVGLSAEAVAAEEPQ